MLFGKSTRFAGLAPRNALLIVLVVMAIVIYGLIVYHPTPPTVDEEKAGGEDLRCYRSIVERIRAGEGYYEAAGDELRTRGYDTHSVFNWRLPSLAWLLAGLPRTGVGRVLLIVLSSLTVLMWTRVLGQNQHSFAQLVFGSLALLGPVIYAFLPDLFLLHDIWAGTLISLSLAAHAKGWRPLSVASGLFALFLRELALPFVCVMLVLSYLQGRRREALVWSIGIIAFCAALLLHWSMVKSATPGGQSVGLQGGWMVFGGWPFVLSTAKTHPYLFLAPPWATAIILPLALLGLAGWRGQLGSRVGLTVGVYILAFLIVGMPYNRYWGLTYNGVLLLGL
ncbi:MAG: hypothetical protein ABIJ00_02120, partial [Candidatus Eisenbacteria bacterium]